MDIGLKRLNNTDELVGVYGTLKRGQPNHSVLGDSPLVEEGWVKGLALYDIGPFPCAVLEEHPQPIFVEVYAVSKAVLAKLDKLENYYPDDITNSLYTRKHMQAIDGASCWIYLFNEDIKGLPFIQTGVWLGEGLNY